MKWLLPLALLAVSHPAAPPSAAPEAPLDQAALRRHIEYLASDSLQGRAPGSEGGVKAAYYIASELAGAGLAPGAPDGSWYQPVDLVERTPMTATAEWRVKGHAIALDPSLGRFIAMEGGTRLVAAPVVFAGYGTTTGGADLKGKVVLLLSGKPSEGVQGFEVRRRAIAAQGAAAVIALSGENDPWALIHDQLGRGRTVASGETHAPVEGALAFPAWIRLVDPELVVAAKSLEFSPHLLPVTLDLSATSHVRRYSSVNVIARIAGHGRAGEAVLFLAHWDHLGLCRPEGAADRICNGAVDNASGIAALIEVARNAHLAELKCARVVRELDEVRNELEDDFDTIDGDDGQPRPNKAMRLANKIDEAIYGPGGF